MPVMWMMSTWQDLHSLHDACIILRCAQGACAVKSNTVCTGTVPCFRSPHDGILFPSSCTVQATESLVESRMSVAWGYRYGEHTAHLGSKVTVLYVPLRERREPGGLAEARQHWGDLAWIVHFS